jgi:hypothetical protein
VSITARRVCRKARRWPAPCSGRHALTARKPKTRYLVGTDAKIQARVRKLVPDRVFDRLIAREFGS